MLAKTYRRAAELVAQGWCQWALTEGDAVCLVEALWRASHEIQGRLMTPAEWVPLATALARHGWTGRYADWNDARRRTPDQVETVLIEAAGLAG